MAVLRAARSIAAAAFIATAALPVLAVGAAPFFEVKPQEIDDLKSVYATVRSKNLTLARVRTPGTIVSLKVDYGDWVKQGQVMAVVVDPKIALAHQGARCTHHRRRIASGDGQNGARSRAQPAGRRDLPRRRASTRRRRATTWRSTSSNRRARIAL